MKSQKFRFSWLIALLISPISFVGCGKEENTVIERDGAYEPTETEKENADREAQEREAEQG